MRDVVSPRAVTYSGTFHQWFTSGVSASRTLPTTCVHMCSVSHVSFHSASGSAGQQRGSSESFAVISPLSPEPAAPSSAPDRESYQSPHRSAPSSSAPAPQATPPSPPTPSPAPRPSHTQSADSAPSPAQSCSRHNTGTAPHLLQSPPRIAS